MDSIIKSDQRDTEASIAVDVKTAERSDGFSGETLLAPCTRKKSLQRKMTKDYYWIGVQETIGMFSNSAASVWKTN